MRRMRPLAALALGGLLLLSAVAIRAMPAAADGPGPGLAGTLARAPARLAADFGLWWHAVAGGGGHSAAGNVALDGTIGQALVGTSSGPGYQLAAGFWTSAAVAPGPRTMVVNTTAGTDDGRCDAAHCSLREALNAAAGASGPTQITFDIPTTDPGHDPASGVWTIRPTDGYNVPPNTTVDGLASGGRPAIEIDGTTLAAQGIIGLWAGADVTLRGLVVNHFQYGVWIASPDVTVTQCYIGTDATGATAKPNGADGLLLAQGTTAAVIEGNLIAGNSGSGLRLFGAGTTGNAIRNNLIGTNAAGTAALANGGDGIRMHAGTHDNSVAGNVISGNSGQGVGLLDEGTDGHVLRDNHIGTDATGATALPNGSFGVSFFAGPRHNVVGPGNVIANNGSHGVLVDGSDSFTSTVGNRITANSIHANAGNGIQNFRGGNTELTPPALTAVGASTVSGSACPGCTVEVFSDTADEGAIHEGSATADGGGNWTFSKTSRLDRAAAHGHGHRRRRQHIGLLRARRL